MKHVFCSLLLITGVGISALASAQMMPSPAMIEQFKNLPKAQQEALAKQYGIDLDTLNLGTNKSNNRLGQPGIPLEQPEEPFDAELFMSLFGEQMDQPDDEEEEGLKRYGQGLFDADVSTFAPTDNANVPLDYRLGVGDELAVQLFGKDNKELTLQVNRDGVINFPQLGPINVAGLLLTEATDLIKARVENGLIGVKAVVTMNALRSINVFMAGEVVVPGAYSVSALTTVSQALFQSGGITEIGSMRNIEIKRQGNTIAQFDVYDLLMRGDASNDIRLSNGDVVFVPTYEALVQVDGEVKRPMEYELQTGQTVSDALQMAGGLKQTALDSKVILIQKRPEQNLPRAYNLDAQNTQDLAKPLFDGDRLFINPISDAIANAITLKGAVVREGDIGWEPNMRVSDIIVDVKRDLKRNADLQYSLITREKNAKLDIEVIQFSVVDALANPGSDKDPLVNVNDQILVFDNVDITELDEDAEEKESADSYEFMALDPQTMFLERLAREREEEEAKAEEEAMESPSSREVLLAPVIEKLKVQAREGEPVKIATIAGAVKSPGDYPINAQYTIADLVLAAGGLKDSAFLKSVEQRRLIENDGDIVAQYTNIDLTEPDAMASKKLMSRDYINVRENPDWNPLDTITLVGEVRFPGTYLIQPGERISDVIRRAGGFTPEAFVEAAIFTREEIARLETEQAKEFAQSVRRDFATSMLTEEIVNSTYADIQEVTEQLEDFEGQGRLLIDLLGAMSGNRGADVVVVDGDTLTVPRKTNTITVVGEVRKQGTHSYQESLSLDDYVTLSAGFTKRADEDAIYVVKANGSVVTIETSLTSFASNSAQLAPGDSIIIPVDSSHKDQIPLWRDITQIVYQGTIAIAAVARL